jgi:ribosomal protein S8
MLRVVTVVQQNMTEFFKECILLFISNDQGYMKQLVANNIKKLIKEEDRNNENKKRKLKNTEREHREWRTIKNIKQPRTELYTTQRTMV